MANEALVPELLQDDVTPEAISAYMNDLIALDLSITQDAGAVSETHSTTIPDSTITHLPVLSKADEQSADVVTRYLLK